MAGEADFTADEWVTMRRALTSAGIVIAMAEGGGGDMLSEVFAVTQKVRGAGLGHPNQLVRELASMGHFQTGLRPGMKRAAYEEETLATIRTATAAIARKAPADLKAFRAFVVELAEAAANAHKEGGLGGLGGIRVTAAEAAAIARVKRALGAG
jgi:hypothetical protein